MLTCESVRWPVYHTCKASASSSLASAALKLHTTYDSDDKVLKLVFLCKWNISGVFLHHIGKETGSFNTVLFNGLLSAELAATEVTWDQIGSLDTCFCSRWATFATTLLPMKNWVLLTDRHERGVLEQAGRNVCFAAGQVAGLPVAQCSLSCAGKWAFPINACRFLSWVTLTSCRQCVITCQLELWPSRESCGSLHKLWSPTKCSLTPGESIFAVLGASCWVDGGNKSAILLFLVLTKVPGDDPASFP